VSRYRFIFVLFVINIVDLGKIYAYILSMGKDCV